ncbi:MAG: hypothetical protein V4615_05225 [Bacteroidota bacterium]
MGVVNLTKAGTQVNTSKDGIVIVRSVDDVRAGKSLDVTGFAPKTIHAGHVIIMETTTKNYKPMPVAAEPYTGASYSALPAGHEYVGIQKASVLTDEASVGILTIGTVREEAMPYNWASIKAAFRTARPLIDVAQ